MQTPTNNSLITIHTFGGQDFLIRFQISQEAKKKLEVKVTDKQVGEEWQCSYDDTYIEKLTSKTGNYKSFEIFTKMLNSGLLKSSRSITLHLLSHKELYKFQSTPSLHSYFKNSNDEVDEKTRYLIIGYITEFDTTYYPLILNYIGPPDVTSLISTVRRLESELTKTREDFASYKLKHRANDNNDDAGLQKRIEELTKENKRLEVALGQKSTAKTSVTKAELAKSARLEHALLKLEKSIVTQQKSHKQVVDKLEKEKKRMQFEIDTLKRSEMVLKQRLLFSQKSSGISSMSERQSNLSRNSVPKVNVPNFSKQRPPQRRIQCRSLSRGSRASSGGDSSKSQSSTASKTNGKYSNASYSSSAASSIARSEKIKVKLQASEKDFKTLEDRINGLQKKLLTNTR